MADLKSSVIHFCAEIGNDSLLVQGAGGNVSWKEDGALWVKASGTWLADAATDNIFVPVDLNELQKAINAENFSAKPTLISQSDLKPSIETLLHALMPHPVVVHLHAIEILAYLVRSNCEKELASVLGDKVPWVIVDYFRPGAELAEAINNALDGNRDTNVIFLKNHGVVIGGADINEIWGTLNQVTGSLRTRIVATPKTSALFWDDSTPLEGYAFIGDKRLQQLAIDPELFARLTQDWALYPDHVVFLGPRANQYNSFDELKDALSLTDNLPELVFVRDTGVLVTKAFGKAKIAQLRCYYDVLARQPQGATLAPISSDDISDLLNRDDEKHRMRFSKQ